MAQSLVTVLVNFKLCSKILGSATNRQISLQMLGNLEQRRSHNHQSHGTSAGLRSATTLAPSQHDTDNNGIAVPSARNSVTPYASSKPANPLSRLPLPDLIRNLALTYVFGSPFLTRASISIMQRIADSKSPLLSPDRNPLINKLVRWTVYNHLGAGETPAEVKQTVDRFRSIGYDGVIIGYGKEVIVDQDTDPTTQQTPPSSSSSTPSSATEDKAISAWLNGNLQTLSLLGKDDYLAIKLTGAGTTVNDALIVNSPPPTQLLAALHRLCDQAAQQKSLVWMDAEQQIFQPAIDEWTIDLMRKYNGNGRVLVSNTIQAYLKSSRENVTRHLKLAREEGWALGIKFVRGAYISSDKRERIWDMKEQTDDNYNGIMRDLIREEWPGLQEEGGEREGEGKGERERGVSG